jgi:hypothetical protein
MTDGHHLMDCQHAGMTYRSSWVSRMTYDEFQRHIGKAGLTLKEFAQLIRVNRVSISNLSKKGEVPSHLAVIACLMGEMAERRIDFRPALSEIDISPRTPRAAAARGRFGGNRQSDMFALTGNGPSARKPPG